LGSATLINDRLNYLATRENTVIDNPYQNSKIARVFSRPRQKISIRHNSQVALNEDRPHLQTQPVEGSKSHRNLKLEVRNISGVQYDTKDSHPSQTMMSMGRQKTPIRPQPGPQSFYVGRSTIGTSQEQAS